MKITGKLNLAKAFKVSRTTIENWCKSGCPSKFNGKEHEFELSEVIAWHEKKYLKSGDSDTESLTKARAVIAHYKGLITELEYRERAGELIPLKHAKEIAFHSGRMTRDAILNIPNRIAPILIAERDSKKCHELLMGELHQALENLANEFCNGEIIKKLLESEEKNDTNPGG